MSRRLFHYLFTNILAMAGVSCYILADTWFVSLAAGASGITALNLVLPVYGLIFALGAMISVGYATRFSLMKYSQPEAAGACFSQALEWIWLIALPFMIAGALFPASILKFLGADELILHTGLGYTWIVLVCTPFFMMNTWINAFVRNDNDPSLAMWATLTSSFFNIIFDYLFVFPLAMGMNGAALATGLSPLVGMLICSRHFHKPENTLHLHIQQPSIRSFFHACQLGISSFISEIAGAITSFTFNMLLLAMAGNLAVAAYAITANIALVAIAIFNGIANGLQPLASEAAGQGRKKDLYQLLSGSLMAAVVLSGLMIALCWMGSDEIVALFNPEGIEQLAVLGRQALHLYSLGYFFSALNIVICGYLGAINQPGRCFILSISRGVAAITAFALLLARFFGLPGIWLSFPAAELFTFLLAVFLIWPDFSRRKDGSAVL